MKLTGVTRLALLAFGTTAVLGITVLVANGFIESFTAVASAQAQGPRELTVLTGAGQDTVDINAFFPQTIRIRAGDSVTWRIESDQTHVVGFAEGSTPPGPDDPE